MTAYYNEHDPFAAAWLSQLIAAGHIAPGIVDSRSIEDVLPSDLEGFTQCHFFAGIGVWSLALRQAGWSDDRPIWTGSCPCQPFSAAGKGDGFADERHLWPAFHWLIEQCRPELVAGEQVASKDGLYWLDLVQADLEGSNYASGALDTCAAGFGAPHIRQRLYWFGGRRDRLGHAVREGLEGHAGDGRNGERRADAVGPIAATGELERLADTMPAGRPERGTEPRDGQATGGGSLVGVADTERDGRGPDKSRGQPEERTVDGWSSAAGGLADAPSGQPGDRHVQSGGEYRQQPQDRGHTGHGGVPVHPLDYWRDADWLLCRDPDGARFRPVEPGSFPLVDAGALRNRLVEVRGGGNALNISQAQGFIEALMDLIC